MILTQITLVYVKTLNMRRSCSSLRHSISNFTNEERFIIIVWHGTVQHHCLNPQAMSVLSRLMPYVYPNSFTFNISPFIIRGWFFIHFFSRKGHRIGEFSSTVPGYNGIPLHSFPFVLVFFMV